MSSEPKGSKVAAARMIGLGTTCPRCLGEKIKGSCAQGIALSRRGKAAICSPCGTDEAMIDAGLGGSPRSEARLFKALVKSRGIKPHLLKAGAL